MELFLELCARVSLAAHNDDLKIIDTLVWDKIAESLRNMLSLR